MESENGWIEHRIGGPGRDALRVRDSGGDFGGPPLVLLHGLAATGHLNWRPALGHLAERHRVLLVDHRGHGRGLRTRAHFRLADCADDVARLADALEIPRLIPVGYSMGGPVAQLLWYRHPDRVAGLVLCATASRFSSRGRHRAGFLARPWLDLLGLVAPRRTLRRLSQRWVTARIPDEGTRARVLAEVGYSDPVAIVQAAAAVLRFDSRSWIGSVDVPCSVVLTEFDEMVRPSAQRSMAERIPDVEIFPIPGDHVVCVNRPDLFVPVLGKACASVRARAGRSS